MTDTLHDHGTRGGACCASRGHEPAASLVVKDPVCGMTVDPAKTQHHAEQEGTAYHFCSGGCRTKFLADPARYLSPAPTEAVQTPPGTIFTCPMHPEVRQEGPGACPFCGMALEPADVTAAAGPNPELLDMTRRSWIGAAGAVPVVVLAMGGHLLGDRFPLSGQTSNVIQFILASVVVFWSGLPFFERGWHSIVTRHLNMFTLVAIGTGVAWSYSAVATLFPGLFPPAFHAMDGAVGVYFEAAAVITVLVLIGQVLELKARDSTSMAIRGLLDLAPKTARRIAADGAEHDVPLDTVVVGDRLRVRPGETVPVDGLVEAGEATVDQASVTGESLPVSKRQGDAVIGGTVAQDRNSGDPCRTRRPRHAAVAHRPSRGRCAAQSRAHPAHRGPRVGLVRPGRAWRRLWRPSSSWMAVGPEPRLAYAVIAAVSVLIIACPCALGLATPMSIMVGVGRGARAGVLIRNAEALERLAKGRYGGARQDRHLDRRQAGRDRRCGRARFRRGRGDRSRGRGRAGQRTPLAQAIVEAATARGIAIGRGLWLRRTGRARGLGPGRRRDGPGRVAAVPGRTRRRRASALGRGGRRPFDAALRPCWSRSTGRWRGSWVWPTGSDPTAPPS